MPSSMRSAVPSLQVYKRLAAAPDSRSCGLPILDARGPARPVATTGTRACFRPNVTPGPTPVADSSLQRIGPTHQKQGLSGQLSPPPCRGSGTSTSGRVLVFAPGAPAVQILVPAMRALDRSKLVAGFCQGRLASGLCERNGNDTPTRLVLTHPAEVDLPWDHLMRHPDVDVAQAR